MSAPELMHTGVMTIQLGSEQFLVRNGPHGSRLVAEVDSVVIEGERLNANMVGSSAADWLTLGPDNSYGALDVRFTLQTDNEAYVYCEYGGRIDLAAGRAIATPLFQCGDEHYGWLNRSQFLADGTVDRDTNVLTYQLYEVRPV